MGDLLGVATEVWGAVVGALVGIVGAQLLDMRRERLDRQARSREKISEKVYQGVQQEIHKFLIGNRVWAQSPWQFSPIVMGPVENGSLEDPDHQPLRDGLGLLITRAREQSEAWSTWHEKAKAEFREMLKDTRLKTHGEPSHALAEILGDTYFDLRLLSAVFEDEPARWGDAMVGELFNRHGPGWYSYKDPVKDSLRAELLPSFQRIKERTSGEVATYMRTIEALKEQARVIDAGLKKAVRERAFYPGNPVPGYKFWAKDKGPDTS